MTNEELKAFWAGFPEAPYSDSFKVTDPDGFEHLMTIRGWSGTAMLNAIEEAKKVLKERGFAPTGKRPASQDNTPAEPERIAIGDNGQPLPEIKTTTVEGLDIGMFKDRLSVHVIGKPWSKYGIPMYEETWVAAGLDIALGKEKPNINGWTAEYTCKPDGKPLKVTRLLKP